MIIIPEIFQNNDTLYHYTDSDTAINHILKNELLKYSPLRNSYDRMERSDFKLGITYRSKFDDKTKYLFKYNEASKRIENSINDILNSSKSICFCRNTIPKKELHNSSVLNYDNLVFLRARMWEQYGDYYRGVCLVFSKNKLMENNTFDYAKLVKYVNFSTILNDFTNIDLNSIHEQGEHDYLNSIKKNIADKFYLKHKDYRDEKEFRLLKLNSRKEEYIDISNSITGIIVCRELIEDNSKLIPLREYARNKNIELSYLLWEKNGFKILNERTINEY